MHVTIDARGRRADRRARRRRCAPALLGARGRRRASPATVTRSPPSTSPRRRRASRCSTTRPATSTTASSRAFIKSMRGSDPDAAVYWMTRMLEAGEDPRFVLRRMVIFASRGCRQRGSAGARRRDRGALGGRARRPARGRAAADPGGHVPRARAEIEPRAHDLRGRAQAGQGARRPAGAREAAPGVERGRTRARPRRVVQVPARLRGRLRPRGVPARRAGRRAHLRAERLRLRGRAGAPAAELDKKKRG